MGKVGCVMNSFVTLALAIDSGTAKVFDHIENGGPMWSGTGKRWERCSVRFDKRFAEPPAVQLSIAMIDSDCGRNLRLDLSTEEITVEGFTAVAHTWSDTLIGRLHVNWTAIGQRDPSRQERWDV